MLPTLREQFELFLDYRYELKGFSNLRLTYCDLGHVPTWTKKDKYPRRFAALYRLLIRHHPADTTAYSYLIQLKYLEQVLH